MAMGPERGKGATFQHEIACLDELVPADDLYRRIDALVGWSFVREEAAPYYAEALGRPSFDPIVLLKLMLAGALEGIGSMRELLRVASLRLDLRRFLGFGLGERLPAHQTVSDAHCLRFLEGALFERLFARTVALCREHDLIEGTHLSVDGFHLEANAALQSLRASLGALPVCEGEPEPGEDEPARMQAPPQLALADPETGASGARRRRPVNERVRSQSDPDARLQRKPGARSHLVFRGQLAVDSKARCVVACLAERAEGFEGDGLAQLLDRARFHLPELASVAADSGYAAERVWEDAKRRGLRAYIPPQPHMLPDPAREPRTPSEALAQAAHRRCRSEEGRWAHGRRLADGEGAISEAKLQHGLARARCRGLPAVEIQLLLSCAAINLKRLAHRVGAASGAAAQPAVDATCAHAGASAESGRELAHGAAPRPITESAVWTVTICLN